MEDNLCQPNFDTIILSKLRNLSAKLQELLIAEGKDPHLCSDWDFMVAYFENHENEFPLFVNESLRPFYEFDSNTFDVIAFWKQKRVDIQTYVTLLEQKNYLQSFIWTPTEDMQIINLKNVIAHELSPECASVMAKYLACFCDLVDV